MLGKLLKYEIKATGRIFLPFILSIFVFALITRFISAFGPQKWGAPSIISMAIYVVIMVGMFVMTFIVTIQRFYKNLLSDEGYLMFTLPTKSWQHILSKLLVSMMWMVISVLVALISILITAFDQRAVSQVIQESSTFFNQVFAQLGASAYLTTFEIILSSLVSLASSILIVYASIALGHLFRQHKIFFSFGAFILLNTLSQVLFLPLSLLPDRPSIHIASDNLVSLQSQLQAVLAIAIICTCLLSAAYFAITNLILSKHLNLE